MSLASAPVDADLRAKDMYRTLAPRRIVGQALSERVGARGWNAPRFAKGRRLFGRCGLPDPWDPSAPQVEIGLGDVGIASVKRAPAPHAAPPSGPKPPPGFPNIPRAPAVSSTTSGGDAAPGRPAPKIGETRAFKKEDQEKAKHTPTQRPKSRDGTFGAGKVMQPVAKLPMRPGMEGPPALSGSAAPAPAPSARPTTPSMPVALPRTAAAAAAAPFPSTSRSHATSELVELPMPEADAASPGAARVVATPNSVPAPVNRSVTPSKGGLDDLFGMGSGDNTRLRMPKKEDAPPPSRRPMVSTQEEMDKAGIDRRPPSIKPPNVKPSGGGGFDPGEGEP